MSVEHTPWMCQALGLIPALHQKVKAHRNPLILCPLPSLGSCPPPPWGHPMPFEEASSRDLGCPAQPAEKLRAWVVPPFLGAMPRGPQRHWSKEALPSPCSCCPPLHIGHGAFQSPAGNVPPSSPNQAPESLSNWRAGADCLTLLKPRTCNVTVAPSSCCCWEMPPAPQNKAQATRQSGDLRWGPSSCWWLGWVLGRAYSSWGAPQGGPGRLDQGHLVPLTQTQAWGEPQSKATSLPSRRPPHWRCSCS